LRPEARHELIERYLYAFDWDVESLWRLPLAVEERPIADFVWMLDAPVGPGPDGPYTLTPRDVLKDRDVHTAEFARTMKADTAFPIDIAFHRDRWVILDGVHRLLKLYAEKAATVRVRVVPPEHLQTRSD
jgi:hypothetical protein